MVLADGLWSGVGWLRAGLLLLLRPRLCGGSYRALLLLRSSAHHVIVWLLLCRSSGAHHVVVRLLCRAGSIRPHHVVVRLLCGLLALDVLLLDLLAVLLHLLNGARSGLNVRWCDGAGDGDLGGLAVVVRVEVATVLRGLLADLHLRGERSGVGLVEGGELGGARADVNATTATVVADAVDGAGAVGDVVVDHGAVVDVGDVADVGDGAVVVEVMPVPVAAEVAEADIAESVVDAAIEADMLAPVSAMEHVVVA